MQESRKCEPHSYPQPPQNPTQRLPPHLYEKAKNKNLCLKCLDPNHQIKNRPIKGHVTIKDPTLNHGMKFMENQAVKFQTNQDQPQLAI